MNKYILSLLIIISGLAFSCNKHDINNTDENVGISRVIFFPIVELNGSSLMVIDKGTTFTDPGVNATVNGEPVTPTITVSVNTSANGIYYLKYSAVNADGFSASADRIIIVKNATAVAPDYSGNWQRNAGAFGVSRWIQLTPTTYAVSDPGGANYTNFWVIVTVSGTTPVIPAQNVPQQLGGAPTSINSISSGAFTGTTTGSRYNWAINTSGFGTGNRTFVKQ